MSTSTTEDRVHPLAYRFARHCERMAGDGRVAEEGESTVFLTKNDVNALRTVADGGCPILPTTVSFSTIAAVLHQGRGERLRLVIDDPRLARLEEHEKFLRALGMAFGVEPDTITEIGVVVLANAVADCETEGTDNCSANTPLDALVDSIADPIFEVRRRADDYFEREPLGLPSKDAGNVPLLTVESVVGWLASDDAPTRVPGIHVLRAEKSFTWRALTQTIANAANIPVRDANSNAGIDAIQALIELERRHVSEVLALDDEPHAGNAKHVHRISSNGFDWRSLVTHRVAARLSSHCQRTAPRLSNLAGMQRRSTREGDTYLRAGNGGPAILLVNAFGLSNDVWHDFAHALIDRFTVFAIDDETEREGASLPRIYYSTPDALPHFTRAVSAMLAEEGYETCHVASWCGGAKYAIELARALQDTIASLSLFAPSFAGPEGYTGSDSIYEKNLHTMCKLVDRTPQAAQSMAKSMITLLERQANAQNGDAQPSVFELADSATRHWLHAPFLSAPNMVEYSRQLLNFRAHHIESLRPNELGDLPVMLVTGKNDSMTCSIRARAICTDLCHPLHFELSHASHHLINQNSELLARLMKAFVVDGPSTAPPHPRLSLVSIPQTAHSERDEAVVQGEI
jgi:pimeloyl-ACP methyl ester carboxylesterase